MANCVVRAMVRERVRLVVGMVFGLLLLSAVNTAIVAMIGVIYMMARDGEMPRPFTKLNRHGVPAHAAHRGRRAARFSC